MNTISDIVGFNREHSSGHIHESDRTWRMSGIAVALFYVLWMLCAYAF
jgi:hypothetical protein